jgi:predicted site-specific integrase-resolvase
MSTKAAYNVESAAEAYDVSRDTIKRAIHSGALRAKTLNVGKDGRATKISIAAAALAEWHDALDAA